MSVRASLLGLLRMQPGHGYDLRLRYDNLLNPDTPVKPAQVYATLGRLERDHLVTVISVDHDKGPERRTFELTPAGERVFESWLTEAARPEPKLQAVLYQKVVLAILLGRSIETLLDVQRVAHLERMRELNELRRSADATLSLLADYALFHLEADLRWLEVAAKQTDAVKEALESGTPGALGGLKPLLPSVLPDGSESDPG